MYSDHKAIITTHSYLDGNGNLIKDESGDTMYPLGFAASNVWKRCLTKHENVLMVVSGHVGITVPFYSWNTGDNGNKVLQVLVDPQSYDYKDVSYDGPLAKPSGKQDTGLVLYMNFSEDGKTITLDYYSTLLNKFLKGSNYTINLDEEVDEVGSIDMAGLTQFGQVTPLVTDKKTPTLDGTITEGEYSEVKVTAPDKIARGKINSDLTEYFAYDDEYLYYAFTIKNALNTYKLNLHFGSSLYTVAELNEPTHSQKAIIDFNNESCSMVSNLVASKLKNNEDVTCSAARDNKSGLSTYELRISRRYLKQNNSPDNLLSYTLNMGSVVHQFNLGDDVKTYLEGLGVTNDYTWTYNYVYFGTRPETVPDAVETEPIQGGDDAGDSSGDGKTSGGCSSSVMLAPIAIAAVAAVASVSVSKKRRIK